MNVLYTNDQLKEKYSTFLPEIEDALSPTILVEPFDTPKGKYGFFIQFQGIKLRSQIGPLLKPTGWISHLDAIVKRAVIKLPKKLEHIKSGETFKLNIYEDYRFFKIGDELPKDNFKLQSDFFIRKFVDGKAKQNKNGKLLLCNTILATNFEVFECYHYPLHNDDSQPKDIKENNLVTRYIIAIIRFILRIPNPPQKEIYPYPHGYKITLIDIPFEDNINELQSTFSKYLPNDNY